MSAKHKRPFVVFTAVAAICCMVLVTGVRSKADGSHTPDVLSATVETAGPPISPLPGPTVTSIPDPDPNTDADSGRATNGGPTPPPSGELKASPPDTGPARGDREAEPDSGRIVVPQLPVPPGPEPADPGDADELRPSDDDGGKSGKSVKEGKNRGQSGFYGKRGNESDEADDESDDKTAARHGHPTQPQSLDEDLDDQDEFDVEDQP